MEDFISDFALGPVEFNPVPYRRAMLGIDTDGPDWMYWSHHEEELEARENYLFTRLAFKRDEDLREAWTTNYTKYDVAAFYKLAKVEGKLKEPQATLADIAELTGVSESFLKKV